MINVVFAVMFFNKPEQTIECLESIKGHKIYLLNNGSHEDAVKRVLEYCKDKKQIEYLSVPNNLGVAKGRNYLLKQISEDWVFFLDNDITIRPKDWIRYFREAQQKRPDILAFLPKIYNVHLGTFEGLYTFKIKGDWARLGFSNGLYSNKINGGGCIVNKKLFDEVGLYDEEFFVGFEDHELAIRAIKSGNRIIAMQIPQIVLRHDHRKVQNDYDNDYLKVRYDSEEIRKSYMRILKIHNTLLPDDGVAWSKRQIESMKK